MVGGVRERRISFVFVKKEKEIHRSRTIRGVCFVAYWSIEITFMIIAQERYLFGIHLSA
jgi:hypothetical protein